MNLTEIQEKWLSELEAHPERQMKGSLGRKDKNGNIKCCCLGQACLIINENAEWYNDSILESNHNRSALSWQDNAILGLNSINGVLKETAFINNINYKSLVDMNDEGLTWPEIAKYIRENPENVFKNIT